MNVDTVFDLVAGGDRTGIESLLRGGREPARARRVTDGATPLHFAARYGHPDIAELLLDAGAEVDARTQADEGARTPLHDAYESGNDDVTEVLLSRGADYDIAVAAARGDFDRVGELLAVDPAAVNDDSTGLSPLGWAGYGQDPEMVPFLIEHGAVLGDEICCPCGTGNVAMLEVFLEAGADPNELFRTNGARPLHAAVAMNYTNRNTGVVERLLAAGANVNGTAVDGVTTPLALARRRQAELDPRMNPVRFDGYQEIIDLLSSHSAR